MEKKKLDTIIYVPSVCPEEGGFFGYKKCTGNRIVKLYIPKDAKRSSATGRKCRCSKAFVCEIVDYFGNKCDHAVSCYDKDFVYKLHEWVESEFCEDRFNECAEGIHFFIQRKEAERYEF